MLRIVAGSTRVVVGLILILVLVLGINLIALGQLSVTAVTKKKEKAPGEFVSLVYSVTNNSGGGQNVTFELIVPDGWAPMGTPPPVTLPDGEKETVFITVQIPATAKAGDYSVTLKASYDTKVYSGSATVSVKGIKGVSVSPPPAKTVGRDTSLTYNFTVKNTGNITDTFEIEADSGHDWVTKYTPHTLHLFPGASKKVEVEVNVPGDAVPGRDPVTVTATSTRDEDIVAEESVYTRILPPSPQAVGGKLYAVLPARLEGTFNQDLGGGTPNGDLNLIANGELGSGDLYFDFGLSDLYTENKVDWNAFDYGEQNYQLSTGNVGLTLSDLISKNGRGISTSIESGKFALSLIDLSGGLKDSGGRLRYERDNLYLGANIANLRTDEDSFALTESVVGRFGKEGYEMEVEAGSTPSAGKLGTAYSVYGKVDLKPMTLDGEAFFIGPDFAGNNNGDKGFRVSQVASGENFSEEISYSYFYQLPGAGGVQTRSTMKTDRLAASLTLDLLGLRGSWPEGKKGRAFRLSGFYELSNREDVSANPTLDLTTQAFQGSFLYRYNNFDYSFTGEQELRTNHLSKETFSSSSIETSFGYNFDGFRFTTGFSHTMTANLTTDERVNSTGTTSFELATTGSPYISLAMTKTGEAMDFDITSTISPSKKLELSLSASASIGGGTPDFGASLDFTYEYDLPLKFIITKGRVAGHVFVDQNENGEKDKNEKGVPELVMTIKDTKVASGKDGYFKFPPFVSGKYKLAIEDLPSKYGTRTKLPKTVTVTKGKTSTVLLPLTELAEVGVRVFSDENQNGKRDTGEGGISGTAISLQGEETETRRVTDDEGSVVFRGLIPGEYTLTLDKETLPPRSEITTKNSHFSFKLASGETKEVEIGSFQRPREIIFGQPPEADYAYSPPAPNPDQQVNFSGGLSTDPDGNITKYEWDFQNDNKVDQTGKIVSHKFPETGSYEVKLTVTDNDGNETSITKTIDVVQG